MFETSSTEISYELPEWSKTAHWKCKRGFHSSTKKRVVLGWISYFTPVQHFYCACGSYRYMKYDRSFVSTEFVGKDGHKKWIESHEKFEKKMQELEEL